MTAPSDLHGMLAAHGAELASRQPELLAGVWRRHLPVLALGVGALTLYVGGAALLGISPAVFASGFKRLVGIAGLMIPPDPRSWSRVVFYLDALGQTLAIAFIGTLMAALLGLPLGFLAARNVIANRILRLLARRSLDTLRSVDTLIWALIWINVVGLGPFAGALAIMTSDLGALGKLGSEALEAADRGAIDGVLAAGGSRLHGIRFGMIPQVLPVFLSQVLYFFESNTRSATIIGIVGAGGIGLQLSEQIRVLEWQQVSFLIVLVLVTVAMIDALSQRLRNAIIDRKV